MATAAIKKLSKIAEKEIKNKLLRESAISIFGKLANSNTFLQLADTVYDIGKSFKRWLDGENSLLKVFVMP